MEKIAMKCNQKQFDKIKPKLKQLKNRVWGSFNDYPYLTNFWCNNFSTANCSESQAKEKNRLVYDEWNEKVFLKACAVKVKEPKEKTYKITKKQIIELCMPSLKTNRERLELIFPEVFENKLTAWKWYKLESNKTLAFVTELLEKKDVKAYGFNFEGNWVNEKNDWTFNRDKWIEATEQEVTEALTKEARRRGFKEGVYIKREGFFNSGNARIKEGNNFNLFGCNKSKFELNGTCIFEEGKWAEILETLTIQEAEEKLNCKII